MLSISPGANLTAEPRHPPRQSPLQRHVAAVSARLADVARLADDIETDLGRGPWQDDASIDVICARLMDAVSDFLTDVAPCSPAPGRLETTDELASALQERAEELRREPPE